MKKGKHTEEQIIGVLKQVEAGRQSRYWRENWVIVLVYLVWLLSRS